MNPFLSLAFLLLPQQPDVVPTDIATKIAAMTSHIEVVRLEKTVRDLVAFWTRHVRSSTSGKRGTGAARSYLEAKLRGFAARSGGRLTVTRETHAVSSRRLGRDIKVVNIVATLRGTSDPDRLYVVGGHYDSINSNPRDASHQAPGANDDGSGTALVVEACRVMSKVPFAATIQFVCFDGEEMGLLGSTAHAKDLATRGVQVDGMITNDIVGNTLGMDGKRRDDYLRCFSYSDAGNDSSGRSLARAATRAARHYVKSLDLRLVYRGDRYGRGGDHRPFHKQGYPSVRFTEPREDYSRQHKNVTERDGKPYGDLPEWVDFGYLAKVCAVNVAVLGELASAPPPPSRAFVRGARDRYAVRLSFRSVPGAVDYEAVWRLTTAPDWQGSRRLGESVSEGRRGSLTTMLEDLCLDDLVVGVRAVGADGSRSRVTVPPEPR